MAGLSVGDRACFFHFGDVVFRLGEDSVSQVYVGDTPILSPPEKPVVVSSYVAATATAFPVTRILLGNTNKGSGAIVGYSATFNGTTAYSAIGDGGTADAFWEFHGLGNRIATFLGNYAGQTATISMVTTVGASEPSNEFVVLQDSESMAELDPVGGLAAVFNLED